MPRHAMFQHAAAPPRFAASAVVTAAELAQRATGRRLRGAIEDARRRPATLRGAEREPRRRARSRTPFAVTI